MPDVGRILEGIVTTRGETGTVHLAPMGPIVDATMTRLVLRPYNTSTTYANLKRTRQGVLHVTDDVELLARAAVGKIETPPGVRAAERVQGWVIRDACRWYEFEVESIDDSQERTEIVAHTVLVGRGRDFFGFNRAMHAVVEAAILATRIEFLPPEQIRAEMERLVAPVEKTAGPKEQQAFAFLQEYIRTALAEREEGTR